MTDIETIFAPVLETDQLVKPISEECPSGNNPRYSVEYAAIRDGLQAPDLGYRSTGAATPPRIDYRSVIQAACLALSKSKDLDIAVWLTQALAGEYGVRGIAEGLGLIRRLLDMFWETIYPQLEPDGDEGFRAKPLNRINTAFSSLFASLPIANGPRTLYEYNASREVPTTLKASQSSQAEKQRARALEDGSPSPEEIDAAIKDTGSGFYETLLEELDAVRAELSGLQALCDAKFKTPDKPYLGKFSDQLTGVRQTVSMISKMKPAPKASSPVGPPEPITVIAEIAQPGPAAPISAPLVEPVPISLPQDPVNIGPAAIFSIARELRKLSASNPLPYLLVRAVQFGVFLEAGSPLDEDALAAPPTDIRVALRRASANEDWNEVLVQTELAMELPCGGCWLDLQHYAWRALKAIGETEAAGAVQLMTAGYLHELPELNEATLIDGSAAAALDTKVWINSVLSKFSQRRGTDLDCAAAGEQQLMQPSGEVLQPPDAFDTAKAELNAGRLLEAIRVLREANLRERSGRGKVRRKVQLAQVCMDAGQHRVALPLLHEVCRQIEQQKLDLWEDSEWVASPLVMLHKCLGALDDQSDERDQIYMKLCLIDPGLAVELNA